MGWWSAITEHSQVSNSHGVCVVTVLQRWSVVGLACVAVGCSRTDRWPMSGRITHGGKPVGEGHISFDPVASGTGGGFAKILNGAYDTRAAGRGQIGGPHEVMIVCYKGLKDPKNPDSEVLLLFQPYRTKTDLPRKAASVDFDVPADWK